MKIYSLHPVSKFIESLEKRAEAQVHQMVCTLAESDGDIGMPYSKKVTNDLFELRIIGSTSIRIFYSYNKNGAILLHAFKKKSGRISKKEIETALARLKEIR